LLHPFVAISIDNIGYKKEQDEEWFFICAACNISICDTTHHAHDVTLNENIIPRFISRSIYDLEANDPLRVVLDLGAE
jgi:hypothetical protein